MISSGEAFIDNIPLSGSRSKYLRSIGYCPQFDSIIEVFTKSFKFAILNLNYLQVLTGREMLTLFARIRGLRSQENLINKELEMLARWDMITFLLKSPQFQLLSFCFSFVDLTQYLDRPCGQYSGGNKRKLNVALALIGRPKVLSCSPLSYIPSNCWFS